MTWTLIVLFTLSALLCIAQGLIRSDAQYFWLAAVFSVQAGGQLHRALEGEK